MSNAASFRASAALLLTSSVLALVVAPTLAEARPGVRGGASSSISRGGGGARGGGGGGGFGGGGSFGGGRQGGGGFDRGGGASASQRASAGQRASASQRPATGGGNRVNGGGNQVNGGGNRVNGGGNRVNGGNNNINTGDVNINRNVNVSDNGYNNNGWNDYYRPVGGAIVAGAVIGAVAATTAAVVGAHYYALPSGCAPYPYGGFSYYNCGSVYYETRYEGDKVVYVVVNRPG